MMDKEKELLNWFKKKSKQKIKKNIFKQNLFSSNIIDSLDGIKLLIFLQKKIKIKIDNEFVENKKKQNINYILKIINKKFKK